MSLLVLIGLALLGLGLAATALVAHRFQGQASLEAPIRRVATTLAGLAAAGILLVLFRGGVPSSLPVPFGTPIGSTDLALDAIGCAFGVPVMLGGAFSLATSAARLLWRQAFLVAAAVLVVIAGDEILLLVAVTAAALAAWGLSVEAALTSLLAIGALAPLLPGAGIEGGDGFASLRAIGAVHGSGLLGAACSTGLGLLFLGRRPRALPGADGVLASLGALVFVRLGLDLGGPAGAFPTGLVIALSGVALSLLAVRDALLSIMLNEVVDALAATAKGVVLLAIGVFCLARGSDLAASDAAAIGATLLLLLTLAIATPIAVGALERIEIETGSLRLGATGGLLSTAPILAMLLAVPLGSLVFLPPLPGLAPAWMIADLLLRPDRLGGSTLPVLGILLLGSFALVLGLSLVAFLRVGLLVLLGRPRTPRAAAALDPPALAAVRPLIAGLGLLAALALLPGPVLLLLSPGIATLADTAGATGAGWFTVGTITGGAVLPPLLVAFPLAIGAILAWRAGRVADAGDPEPIWDGGGAPPPDWLPFGEPRAQIPAPFFGRELGEMLGLATPRGALPGEGRMARVRPPVSVRQARIGVHAARRGLRAAWGDAWRRAPTPGGRAPDRSLQLLALLGLAALLGGSLL